ncbi:MAG: sigma-70 family RNA polymerase sigma factor [Phycisphaerae bacterium]|nr:sigma-70 family RNA polymerase sigma factor [Phycisphaerae bacterium]
MVDKICERRQKKKWLRLLRSGDHEAFAEFIDKYKETVFLCCRRLGLREDEAEDVASETFLAAFKAIGRYSGQAELSTWLWTIAYRQGINYLRKNRKQGQLEAELDEQVGDSREQGPAAVVQGRETEKIVWDAVERLPRLWAMAVILYYREEKSIVDIAKIMQIKENTVKTYLFRGRDRLKQVLAAAFEEDIDDGQ